MSFDTVRARFVIHWFPKFRPGQVRGVPVFTSSLDMFAELRAFRKAYSGRPRRRRTSR
jgi:capsid protein